MREIEIHCRKKVRTEEEETEKQEKNPEGDGYLTAADNEKPLKGACKRFVIPGLPQSDINGYIDKVKLHIKELMENQLEEMHPTKVIMQLIRWKKTVKLVITWDPEDVQGAKDIGDSTADNYIGVELPLHILASFFLG